MFTDMVGYSAMSQKNESLALELLEYHRDILREIFIIHDGNEIKTIGDAFLVEFNSALDAVNCAIEIQHKLHEYNESCEEERNIFLRIGIHVGDVVHRKGDIYGDGVNISSRIEPLAQAGGICISEDVARQVQNKLSVTLHKMSKQALKNIELPVEIYEIQLHESPKNISKTVINKLAVLPFDNMSPDRETDYFSDGLTEELIMHLSRIKELQVVSRTTIMQYKNVQMDMRTLGDELNARYVLEGSVRRHRDDLRITAQLIDVQTDSHLWAETYKGNMADVFDIQESVAKQIVTAMRLTLTPDEEVALVKRSTENTKAFDLNLRAREFLFRSAKSYLLSAVDLFQEAIKLDPNYASAYAGLGEAYAIIYVWHDKKDVWLEKAMDASLKALMYDSSSSEGYSALGLIYYSKRQHVEALTSIEKAIELDPDNFFAYWIKGRIMRALDRFSEAVEQFNKVLELNPDFYTVYIELQMEYDRSKDQKKGIEIVNRALEFFPTYLLRVPEDARAHIFYAGMLLCVEKFDDAKFRLQRAVDLSPNDANMMYNVACNYARLDEKDLAIENLTKAISNGFVDYEYFKRDPDLDGLREELGFIEIMKGH
ncbi:MAG: adenylate cyclase [Bacteroidia bacterium]|jgi:adenylate cyclase